MAIYTQYGRYLKAKQFKELLTETNDTYMVFGIGNPQWDNPASGQNITVAPYNTSILKENDVTTNQFYDDKVCQYFQCYNKGGGGGTLYTHISIEDSDINYSTQNSNQDSNNYSDEGRYVYACQDVNPVFPSTWHGTDEHGEAIINSVTQSNYHEFYITKDDGTGDFNLYKINSSDDPVTVTVPDDNLKRQYFYEMYIRGKSLERNYSIQNTLPGIRVPVGLLGAVRCSVNFVKDIGDNYTGDIDQFWYGDRYWKIVRPDDDPISSNVSLDDRFPHHLLITATVNPRYLCSEISVDNLLVPRQIAIYTAPKNESHERYYRAYENIFNFGQYSSDDINNMTEHIMTEHTNYYGKILNFTIPTSVDTYETTDGEFKLVLHDYIRGQIRDAHSVDRFGYVISF